jgi:predicted ribosomally synthesized peptide with nif11-like leader
MSTEAAEAFLDKIEQDEAFAAELEGLRGNWQEALERIRSAGFDVSEAEVREAFLERYGAELSPEQLDALAAGIDETAATAAGVAIGATAAGAAVVVGFIAAAAAGMA